MVYVRQNNSQTIKITLLLATTSWAAYNPTVVKYVPAGTSYFKKESSSVSSRENIALAFNGVVYLDAIAQECLSSGYISPLDTLVRLDLQLLVCAGVG